MRGFNPLSFYRQYVGIVQSGSSLVYINAFAPHGFAGAQRFLAEQAIRSLRWRRTIPGCSLRPCHQTIFRLGIQWRGVEHRRDHCPCPWNSPGFQNEGPMTQYCSCATCQASVAQPAERVQDRMETIQGARVAMQPGWILAHWSSANFTVMESTEIHNFMRLGHKYRVGASFYLYKAPPPANQPAQLQLMGLGGNNRYTIDHVIAGQLDIYYKVGPNSNPAEVAVILGCGGTITFDQNTRQATGIAVNNLHPVITIV